MDKWCSIFYLNCQYKLLRVLFEHVKKKKLVTTYKTFNVTVLSLSIQNYKLQNLINRFKINNKRS